MHALNAALKIKPSCHEAQAWRGLILFHLGLYPEARQALDEAFAINPEDVRTLAFLGHAAFFRGDYEEAEDFSKRALAAHPAAVWPNIYGPLIPLYMGRPSDAVDRLRVARQMLPEEPAVVSVEGMVAAYEGDFARAEALADAALQPKRTLLHTHHLWHNVAAVFAMCGRPERAVPLLHRCAEMGLPNYLLFSSDPYLQALYDRPDFVELMTVLRRQHEENRQEFGASETAAAKSRQPGWA